MYYLAPADAPPFWRDCHRVQHGHHVYRLAFDIRPQHLGTFAFCSFTAVVDDCVVGGCCGSLNCVPRLEAALSRWLRRFVTPAHRAADVVPNESGYLMLGADRHPPLEALCEALGLILTRT